jgi:hypothetical protein
MATEMPTPHESTEEEDEETRTVPWSVHLRFGEGTDFDVELIVHSKMELHTGTLRRVSRSFQRVLKGNRGREED